MPKRFRNVQWLKTQNQLFTLEGLSIAEHKDRLRAIGSASLTPNAQILYRKIWKRLVRLQDDPKLDDLPDRQARMTSRYYVPWKKWLSKHQARLTELSRSKKAVEAGALLLLGESKARSPAHWQVLARHWTGVFSHLATHLPSGAPARAPALEPIRRAFLHAIRCAEKAGDLSLALDVEKLALDKRLSFKTDFELWADQWADSRRIPLTTLISHRSPEEVFRALQTGRRRALIARDYSLLSRLWHVAANHWAKSQGVQSANARFARLGFASAREFALLTRDPTTARAIERQARQLGIDLQATDRD